MWEPLPLIVYGYAIHPLSPGRRDTRASSRNRLSTVTEASTDDHSVMRDVVTLEVGDEVYAFEKYTPSPREPVEGVWYRGCVRWFSRQGSDQLNKIHFQLCRLHYPPSTSHLVPE